MSFRGPTTGIGRVVRTFHDNAGIGPRKSMWRREMLIAQNDDPELLEWLSNAHQRGGGFVSSLAAAGLRADHENYPIIRPLILQMREKYPEYEPSEAVKREIMNRPR